MKPTKPGYYWFRCIKWDRDWQPVKVEHAHGVRGPLAFYFAGSDIDEYIDEWPEADWGDEVSPPAYFQRLLWAAQKVFPQATGINIKHKRDEDGNEVVEAYQLVRSSLFGEMIVYRSAPTTEELEALIEEARRGKQSQTVDRGNTD